MSAEAPEVAAPAPGIAAIPSGVSIANHPRARVSIRRVRARVALIVFALVILQAHGAGISGQESVLRGLLAGIAGYVGAWAIGLAVWKHIVLAELRAAHQRRQARRAEAVRAAAAAADAAAADRAARGASPGRY